MGERIGYIPPSEEQRQTSGDIIANPMSFEQYVNIYLGLKHRLTAGIAVPEDIDILFLGNNTLLEGAFKLRDKDKISLNGITNAGKSAHIAHTKDVKIACLTMMQRLAKREDHLYRVPAPLLRQIGFSAIYTPTSKHPLHVRIVPHRLDSDGDIVKEDRIKLAELLQRHKLVPADDEARKQKRK